MGGINLHFPLGRPHDPEKEGEKMLGYGLSSLNENHMQEREKKEEERGRGQCVTKASL